jgi:thioredoxin
MAIKQTFRSFNELLAGSEEPILVDFYANWCGPCQLIAKVLEQVSSQLKGRVKLVKIDTDRYPALASQYQVQALPTLILFSNGQSIDRIEGALSSEQLIQRLQNKGI